ncbi:MAG: class I SAM-dependent methyltransferase [Oscillospiraceae bacterium]|nr:class I SAM-dependent methyltransferase [Oscillospiraceae bacterium]
MLFSWDDQIIRWFRDASAYTGFHKTLAQKIKPYLTPGDTFCDLGCGIGRLSLELAPAVSEITAVDISEAAIGSLRRDAEALGIRNLNAQVRDASLLTNSFDVVLMSFFEMKDKTDFIKLCNRRLIRILNAENMSGLYPQRHRRIVKETVPDLKADLDLRGVVYKLELCQAEFGQPFRSWLDAELYIRKNAPEASEAEINEFLNERVTHTGRNDFPFYLPNPKTVGIFITDREK